MSCHLQFSGFTHGDHSLSHGINGFKGTRNSSTLFNLAWSPSFMWDGGVNNLEVQPINPITNPVEMGSDLKDVIDKLNNSVRYRKLFYAAFKDSTVSSKRLLKSLAQFTLLFQSYHSKYDQVIGKEKGIAFTPTEQNGYLLFKQHCASCHAEFHFLERQYKYTENFIALFPDKNEDFDIEEFNKKKLQDLDKYLMEKENVNVKNFLEPEHPRKKQKDIR